MSAPGISDVDADLLRAAVDAIAHTGCSTFALHHSDPDEGTVVWTAVAEYERGDAKAVECGASWFPVQAVLRLLERVLDGGQCTHCKRPCGFNPDLDPMPLEELGVICWYAYDPELKTIRRGCEGDTE